MAVLSSHNATRNTDTVNFILRVMLGAFLVYHGIEVFDAAKMKEYATWMPKITFSPSTIGYIGKAAELITGIMLVIGFGTRIAAAITIAIFLFISFKLGQGRIFMEEQHPFMFVMFGILFLIEGGRRWSLDHFIKNLRRDRRP